MPEIRIKRSVDDRGQPIVRVSLNKPAGLCAVLDAGDFDAWLASGRTLTWCLHGNGKGTFTRVSFCNPDVVGRRSTVARELLGPELRPGLCVGYHDGNPLNLRRENLRVTPGFAKGETKALTIDNWPPAFLAA